MGTFFANLQVKGDDPSAVELALADADALPAYVTDSEGGWVSVYPQATDAQDLEVLERFGAALSATLPATVLALLVHDSDVFLYTLFEGGRAVDKYNSAPGSFEGATAAAEGGDVGRLLPHCTPGTTSEALVRILHEQVAEETPVALRGQIAAQLEQMAGQLGPRVDVAQVMAALGGGGTGKEVFAERLAARLGRCLGIGDARMTAGWRDLAEGEGPPAALVEPG